MAVECTVRPGGLMRCCLESIATAMDMATKPPQEGDKLQCKYHDGDGMRFRDGAWEWNHDFGTENIHG